MQYTRAAETVDINKAMAEVTYRPAMEMTSEERIAIIKGRKEFFNKFYPQVVSSMRSRGRLMLQHIAKYRDKNIEILSSPYPFNYTLFGVEDQKIVWTVTGINEDDVQAEIDALKKEIKDGCVASGYTVPASLFVNLLPFRVILLLMIRYYMERGDREHMEEICAYTAYSMFYTVFHNSFPKGVNREIMMYTVNQMTKKHMLRNQESVDKMITYGIVLCANTYKKRIMDCTDDDIIYIIQQWKSRLRGYFVSIARQYFPNAEKKEAIFTSSEKVDSDDGTDIIERESRSGTISKLSQQYSQQFFQRPLDDQIILICSRLSTVSKNEIKNALTTLRSDKGRIHEVKAFYEAIFYLYLQEADLSEFDVHSKKFLVIMESFYKKGSSKEKNITMIKEMLDRWLTATSPSFKEANGATKVSSLKKAIFQYFVYVVAMRG